MLVLIIFLRASLLFHMIQSRKGFQGSKFVINLVAFSQSVFLTLSIVIFSPCIYTVVTLLATLLERARFCFCQQILFPLKNFPAKISNVICKNSLLCLRPIN